MEKESQCNLESLAKRWCMGVSISLYPPGKRFLHLRNMPQALIGKKRATVLQEVDRISSRLFSDTKKQVDYFAEVIYKLR